MRVDRVVLDTNVLISAALWPAGAPRAVLDAVARRSGALVFSDETFNELEVRLLSAKFDRYASRAARLDFLFRLGEVSERVRIVGGRMGCRDPDDDKILETAHRAKAGALVTGDRDLLDMRGFAEVAILTPAAFLDRLGES